jgi:hypothetical protein
VGLAYYCRAKIATENATLEMFKFPQHLVGASTIILHIRHWSFNLIGKCNFRARFIGQHNVSIKAADFENKTPRQLR